MFVSFVIENSSVMLYGLLESAVLDVCLFVKYDDVYCFCVCVT